MKKEIDAKALDEKAQAEDKGKLTPSNKKYSWSNVLGTPKKKE